MFCGAGGSSLGAAAAGAEITLAINHWRLAVETHSANFLDTLHDVADVSATDPRRYPRTTILLASPECTHHTFASGRGRPKQRDLFSKQEIDPTAERSRATMYDVPRFAEHHRYEIVIVENVVEARKWEPFDAWMLAMDSLGYHGRIVYLNSMFFHPTPQSRDRMYVVFWKKGNKKPDLEFRPRAWCPSCSGNVEAVQAWRNPERQWGRWGRYRQQYDYRCPACTSIVEPYYYAAANVIDWSDLGERIGDRERPLAPRTMKRIERGLALYGNQSLLVRLAYSHSQSHRTRPLTDPLMAQTDRQTVGLLSTTAWLASVNYFRPDHGVEEPFPTQTTGNQYALASTPFFLGYANGDGPPHPISDPLGTQHGANAFGVVSPAPFLVQLRNNQDAQSVAEPVGTVTAGGIHHALVQPSPFLLSYYGSENHRPVSEPVATITSVDRHALVSPGNPPAVEDCHFRMLRPHEIGRAMNFPDDYVVHGTQRDQVKQYGNAVTPPVMQWLMEQSVRTLL